MRKLQISKYFLQKSVDSLRKKEIYQHINKVNNTEKLPKKLFMSKRNSALLFFLDGYKGPRRSDS